MRMILVSILLLLTPNQSYAESVLSNPKVAHVEGIIDSDSKAFFLSEMAATASIDGDRLIMIDSPGGEVSAGMEMIDALEAEKARGVHVTCVVKEVAASMAFNILTHCDTRIAESNAILLFHKIEIGGRIPGVRFTARNLRKIADELDKLDESFRKENADALGMSETEYDFYADHETVWNPSILYRLGYLNNIIQLP